MPPMKLRQQLDPDTRLSRHRHTQAYAAIVLSGGYREAGNAGRWHAQPGDVLIHTAFSSHLDHVVAPTAILNLPVPPALHVPSHARVRDPDLLVRVAERDPLEAAGILLEQLLPGSPAMDEPIDRLAALLSAPGAPSIEAWSRLAGVRRETLFRRFRRAYGTSPTQYRVEARARLAWCEITAGDLPLAGIAANLGFADQAHMSRAVRALTGLAPGQWRVQHSFKRART